MTHWSSSIEITSVGQQLHPIHSVMSDISVRRVDRINKASEKPILGGHPLGLRFCIHGSFHSRKGQTLPTQGRAQEVGFRRTVRTGATKSGKTGNTLSLPSCSAEDDESTTTLHSLAIHKGRMPQNRHGNVNWSQMQTRGKRDQNRPSEM